MDSPLTEDAAARLDIPLDNQTIFKSLIQLLPQWRFHLLVKKHNTDHAVKSLSSWDHFIALFFGHLAGASSLRDLIRFLEAAPNLGLSLELKKAPARNTLAYANRRRNWRLFKDAYFELRSAIDKDLAERGLALNFNPPPGSLDSTTIALYLNAFDWLRPSLTKNDSAVTPPTRARRRLPPFLLVTKGQGLKSNGLKPESLKDPELKAFDQRFIMDEAQALTLKPPEGSLIVFDQPLSDYGRLNAWLNGRFHFIAPLKRAAGRLIEPLSLPTNLTFMVKDSRSGEELRVIEDCLIELTSLIDPSPTNRDDDARGRALQDIRRIAIKGGENVPELWAITSDLTMSADTVSAIFNGRWRLVSFFKCVKRNELIRAVFGSDENSFQCQIWSALSALIFTKYLRLTYKN
jgi:hypothetical protein